MAPDRASVAVVAEVGLSVEISMREEKTGETTEITRAEITGDTKTETKGKTRELTRKDHLVQKPSLLLKSRRNSTVRTLMPSPRSDSAKAK